MRFSYQQYALLGLTQERDRLTEEEERINSRLREIDAEVAAIDRIRLRGLRSAGR